MPPKTASSDEGRSKKKIVKANSKKFLRGSTPIGGGYAGFFSLQAGVIITTAVMFGLALVTFFFNLSAPNRSYIKSEYTTQYVIVYLYVTLVFVGTGVLSTFTFKKNHRKILAGTIVVLVAAVWWFLLSVLSFIPAIHVYKYVCIMDRCPPTQWIFELPWREAYDQMNSSDDETSPTTDFNIDDRAQHAGGNEQLYIDAFWPEDQSKNKQKTGNKTAPTEDDETSGNNKTLSKNGAQSDNESPSGNGALQENQKTPMDGKNGSNSVAPSGNETSKDNRVLQENQATPMEGNTNDSTTNSSSYRVPLILAEPETEECPTRLVDAELFAHDPMEIVEPYLAQEYQSDDNDDYDDGNDGGNNDNTDDEYFDDVVDGEKLFTDATDVSDEATSRKTPSTKLISIQPTTEPAAQIEESPRGRRILQRTENSLETSPKRQKWNNLQWHAVNFMSGVMEAFTENDRRAGNIAMSVICFLVYSIFLAYGIWSMFYLYREAKRRKRRRLSRSRSAQGSIGSGRHSMASTYTPTPSRSTTPTHSRTSNPSRHVSYDQNA